MTITTATINQTPVTPPAGAAATLLGRPAPQGPPTVRRRLARLLTVLLVAVLSVVGLTSTAGAQVINGVNYLDCRYLSGAGSYANPFVLGAITQPTEVYNCPPLSSGSGYNVRYFSFTLVARPSAGAYVMTYYTRTSSAQSGVHPRLAYGATTVKSSLSAQYLNGGSYEGFYLWMNDLWAGNAWRIGAEKLSSPLGSTQTAWYRIVLVP